MKRFIIVLSYLLSAFVLFQLCACTNTQNTETVADAQTEPLTETVTEAFTETNAVENTVITEADGKADVTLPSGVSYTATGYESAGDGAFRIKKGFEARLKESVKENFNRITFKYSASGDFKLYISYILDSKEKTDTFYVEADPDGVFSCLISSYLNGGTASELTAFKADTCKDEEADFIIDDIKVENRALIGDSTYYIENSRFKVGVKLGWGGGINYIEDKNCKIKKLTNLVNSHDTGRLVQQSYYGTSGNDEYQPGKSFDTRWVYNPVQGGDQFGNASRLIDLTVTDNSVYVKAQPQDWSLDGKITQSYMENTYTLFDDYIRVDNRFIDFSGWEHPYSGQELPAFYTVSYLSRFSWYNGDKPWQDEELTYRDDLRFWGTYAAECTFPLKVGNTETWCSWTSPESDFGIGLYVPNVDVFKAGKFEYNNSKSASDNATNYVAPVNVIKMIPYQPIEYSYLITAGSVEEIRSVFKANKDFAENASLHENYISGRVFGSAEDLIKGSLDSAESVAMISNVYNSEVEFSEEYGAAKIIASIDSGDPHVSFVYDTGDQTDTAQYGKLTIEYMIPEENPSSSFSCDLFICAGETTAPDGVKRVRRSLVKDGQFHTLEINLSSLSYWKGVLHEIRFDYFDDSRAGEIIYLKSFRLS